MHIISNLNIFRQTFCLFIFLSLTVNSNADAPMVKAGITKQLTDNVYIIPDNRISLVPNIGIIVGKESIMVVDTGMGPRNAELVLQEVRIISDLPVAYLAITHFHPEHGMGAQSFPAETRIIVPQAQKLELAEKGESYIDFFSGMSPEISELLSEVKLVSADITFEKEISVDLGGLIVKLLYFHAAHTRGDMFIYLPDQKLLFGGDIIVDRFFPIMPDEDSSVLGWMKSLKKLKALKPEIVVPGHGSVSDVSLIDQLSIYLAAMKLKVSLAKRNELSLEETLQLLIPQFQRSYSHWDDPHWIKNAIERLYAEI
ncbi:MAG: MBL fold metallo-hydrolase [Gammaproteobacteria bacterium]|jgi:glyoxylase-like metal-dependent hydrolase (beta-lactamase superfamily II)|nr:MBL fold metallo-hydrolase [Gammaproteobacteria bacterium]